MRELETGEYFIDPDAAAFVEQDTLRGRRPSFRDEMQALCLHLCRALVGIEHDAGPRHRVLNLLMNPVELMHARFFSGGGAAVDVFVRGCGPMGRKEPRACALSALMYLHLLLTKHRGDATHLRRIVAAAFGCGLAFREGHLCASNQESVAAGIVHRALGTPLSARRGHDQPATKRSAPAFVARNAWRRLEPLSLGMPRSLPPLHLPDPRPLPDETPEFPGLVGREPGLGLRLRFEPQRAGERFLDASRKDVTRSFSRRHRPRS